MISTNANLVTMEKSMISNLSTKGKTVSKSGSDFGKCFDDASRNVKQYDMNNDYDSQNKDVNNKNVEHCSTDEKTGVDTDTDTEAEQVSSDKKVSEAEAVNNSENGTDEVDQVIKDKVDEVLIQIMEQIKKILGISDEALNNVMETEGMSVYDLLDSKNLTHLLVSASGAESSIDLVANEELYTSLQDILKVVEDNVNLLLEDTGIANEELEQLLQTQKNMEFAEYDEMYNGKVRALHTDVSQELSDVKQETTIEIVKEYDASDKFNDTAQGYHKEGENEPNKYGQQQNTFSGSSQGDVISQLSSDNSTGAYTSETTSNIIRQIADMIKIVRREQLTEMELQLHPASLGNVKVSLASKGGVVTAEFITQNENVKAAIEAQAVQLKADLEEQGVKIEAIEVSVASHQLEKNLEQNNRDDSQAQKEQDKEIHQKTRRNSINFNSFENGEELLDEIQGADDATRIAMEMMSINGNSMDLLA